MIKLINHTFINSFNKVYEDIFNFLKVESFWENFNCACKEIAEGLD